MTLYINPVRRSSRQRMMDKMIRNWDEDYSNILNFPIDVIADNEAFTIKALLPGVQPEDLDLQILNEIVTISGELKADREEEENYLVAERPSGRFHRVITLPTALDSNKVEADLENGVLTIHIPKVEAEKPHTIKIKRK